MKLWEKLSKLRRLRPNMKIIMTLLIFSAIIVLEFLIIPIVFPRSEEFLILIEGKSLQIFYPVVVNLLAIILSIVGSFSMIVFERIATETTRTKDMIEYASDQIELGYGKTMWMAMEKVPGLERRIKDLEKYRNELKEHFSYLLGLMIVSILINLALLVLIRENLYYDPFFYFGLPVLFLVASLASLVYYLTRFISIPKDKETSIAD